MGKQSLAGDTHRQRGIRFEGSALTYPRFEQAPISRKTPETRAEWKQSLVSHFMHDTLPLVPRITFHRARPCRRQASARPNFSFKFAHPTGAGMPRALERNSRSREHPHAEEFRAVIHRFSGTSMAGIRGSIPLRFPAIPGSIRGNVPAPFLVRLPIQWRSVCQRDRHLSMGHWGPLLGLTMRLR